MRSAAPKREPSKWAAIIIKVIHGFVGGAKDIANIVGTILKAFWELVKWMWDITMIVVKWLIGPEAQLIGISLFFVSFFAAVVWQYGEIGEHFIGKIRTPEVLSELGKVVKKSAPVFPMWGAWVIGILAGFVINVFQMLPDMGNLFNKYAKAFATIERDSLNEKFETMASKAKSPLGWSLSVMRSVSIAFFTFELISSSAYAWEIGILGSRPEQLIIGLIYVIPFMVFGPWFVTWITSHGISLITHYAKKD